MGAKTWMLVYSEGNPREILQSKPALNREATAAFAKKLFPTAKLEALDDVSLSFTCPPDDELMVGCFPGMSIVAAKEFGIDYPSKLRASFLKAATPNQSVYLHAMHSVVDWFAYAIWHDGKLQRSLSLSPDRGLIEDIGARLPFEEPYWAGRHPAFPLEEEESGYPFPFHPLELGEAALLNLFGYQLEGDPSSIDLEDVPLMHFKRSKSWWRWG